MDLTDMMKRDSAIVDHEWMKSQNGLQTLSEESILNVDSMKNPNNCKPELEMQWGGGGPTFEFDEPAGVVERNLGDDSGVIDDVIVFARDMMNRGLMGSDLNRALRGHFDKQTLMSASTELSKLLKLEGIIGCIAVDGRGYKDCKAALAATDLSPFKGHIRYVIGCHCGTPHELPRNSSGSLFGAAVESTGSAVDDFLASAPAPRVQMVAHCRSTMLPILSDDLDPSEMQDGLMDVTDNLQLPQGLTKKLWKTGGVPAFQAAFKWYQKNREAISRAGYTEKVDVSEHVISASEPVVEFNAPAKAQIEIDATNPSKNPYIAIDGPAPSTMFDGVMDLGSEIVAELANLPVNPIDILLGEQGDEPQFRIAAAPVAPRSQDVELGTNMTVNVGRVATPDIDLRKGEMPVRVNAQRIVPKRQEVEMKTDMTVSVNKVTTPDIDMRSSEMPVRVDARRKHVADQDIDINQSLGNVWFGDAPNTDVDFDNGDIGIDYDPEQPAEAPLDVAPGGLFDDLDLSPGAGTEEIDMLPDLTGEFEGVDEIDLETKSTPFGGLDIEF